MNVRNGQIIVLSAKAIERSGNRTFTRISMNLGVDSVKVAKRFLYSKGLRLKHEEVVSPRILLLKSPGDSEFERHVEPRQFTFNQAQIVKGNAAAGHFAIDSL